MHVGGPLMIRQLSLLAPLAVVLAACGPEDMGMEQAVLFSAIEGQVVKGGQPVTGATLTREWTFTGDGKRGNDTAITDDAGRFAFAVVIVPYQKSRFLAQQPVISQAIKLVWDGEERRVWVASKHDLLAGTEQHPQSSNGQAPDRALRVTIDLDAPRQLRGGVVGQTIFVAAP